MTVLYELLGNVLAAIEPRNERARTWLDKMILSCHTHSRRELNPILHRATVTRLREEFQFVQITQGKDFKQRELYDQAEHLLTQLEDSASLPFGDPGAHRGSSTPL